MIVNAIDRKGCEEILAKCSLGRLACCLDNQPYVIPIHFAYEDDYAYFFSTFGQKIEWMRINPKVCLQVDEILTRSHWMSVVANGTFEELPEPQYATERSYARSLLQKRYQWWLNALAERQARTSEVLIDPLFFRIRIVSMTGLRAEDEPAAH